MHQLGHVGDPERKTEEAARVPNFDQSQLDYLRKTFPVVAIPSAAGLDDLVANNSTAAIAEGQRKIFDHIQSLIDQRKEANS